MNLYLVRHGQTDNNKNHIVQGVIEANLNENGINQALKLKKDIDKIDIDLLIVSPLIRTRQTADIIINNRNIKTIYDDRIIERYAGDLEGKKDKYYDSIKAWDYNLNTDLGYNIEKIKDLLKRAKDFLDDLKNKYSDKSILIVSHEAVIRAIHYNIVGYNDSTNFKEFEIDNCSLFKYNI